MFLNSVSGSVSAGHFAPFVSVFVEPRPVEHVEYRSLVRRDLNFMLIFWERKKCEE